MNAARSIRKARIGALCALMLACVLVSTASAGDDSKSDTSAKKQAASSSKTGVRKHSSRRRKSRVRGQQKIDAERALAIQEALIREHYLTGKATGAWNQASEEAMRRYQEDNGWQSKTVPDSRALIKLGLGPSKDHLLNPESAMTTVPDAPHSETAPPVTRSTPTVANPPSPAAPNSTPAPTSTPASTNASGPQ